MSTVIEHYTSRSETSGLAVHEGEAELLFHVTGCPSSLVARDLVKAKAPERYHSLTRGTMSIEPRGAGIYHVKVRYGGLTRKVTMRLDVGAEKIRTIQSIRTIANVRTRYTNDDTLLPAPDFKGLLNVGKSKIEGLEVYAPGSFKLNLHYSDKYGSLHPNYLMTVKAMVATVNDTDVVFTYENQQFFFEKGSLLFTGATFSDSTDGTCEMNFAFEGRDSETQIAVGDLNGEAAFNFTAGITSGAPTMTDIANDDYNRLRAGMVITGPGIQPGTTIQEFIGGGSLELSLPPTVTAGTALFGASNPYLPAKEGHWYVWLRTVSVADNVAGVMLEIPDSAHIEQVYRYADFDDLEIFDVIATQEQVLEQEAEDDKEAEMEEDGFAPLPEDFGSTFPVSAVRVNPSSEGASSLRGTSTVSGELASLLFITGSGFSTTPSNNVITFNLGATGTCIESTSTTATIRFDIAPGVPEGNGQLGSLYITVSNSSGSSGPVKVLNVTAD